ncbi:MAG: non-canonical purine NTP diphosphatase [Prevotella sp.]|nr:non-canonical purine NTP diphosphatase [Prevotella sp.]MBQ6208382.1 non-canonical purine NTP diphosphatase [Prevotella sp.]
MKKIVFATNNKHKLDEIRKILSDKFEIVSLHDIGCDVDIPETGDTLEDNALMKAEYVKQHYGLDCFADDTGLEVEALDGEPGVHSARYAEWTDHDSEANMDKLLGKLGNNNNRKARFRTVIALLFNGETHLFDGIVNGNIISERHGTEGFGYDPIFVPDGYEQTFAELGMEIKNQISHRARAVNKLAVFLNDKT